uniref:Uncharacterized protein n=1 Tax=Kalanchoe fedtschenkoi TaxID=63787 RepID=A0A7N0TLP1_KALFE
MCVIRSQTHTHLVITLQLMIRSQTYDHVCDHPVVNMSRSQTELWNCKQNSGIANMAASSRQTPQKLNQFLYPSRNENSKNPII